MIQKTQILALCFSSLLPCFALAKAPAIEDRNNFATLDEQQVEQVLPVAREYANENASEEKAFAQDDDVSSANDAELIDKVQQLQKEVQELRGQVEVQAHDLTLLRQQQLTFYKDLDDRLHPLTHQKIETLPIVQASPTTIDTTQPIKKSTTFMNDKQAHSANRPTAMKAPQLSSGALINPVNEQINYLSAYDLVKNKQYDDALVAMQTFVTRYPDGGYTANAQYWIGELYLVKQNYPNAIKHFEIVLKQFPSSSKAAACSLKIGYALAASGKKTEALQQLRDVLKDYPNTPTAQLAAAKLTIINES